MPLYVYECGKCGKTHEVLQKFSDAPLKKCPACGGRLRKQIHAASFQFKGGGWYKDGYATPKPEKKTEGEKKPESREKPAEKKEEKKVPEKKA